MPGHPGGANSEVHNTGRRLPALAAPRFSSSTLAIPISLAASAPLNTTITINVHVAGQFTCDRNGIDATLTVLTRWSPPRG